MKNKSNQPNPHRSKNYVRNLVLMAIFAALSIILTRYLSLMLMGGTVRLGFGSIPIIFSGMVLGPVAGGIVGVVSDLLGILLSPQGQFHPGFTLSAALTGIIPGLVVMLMKNRKSLLTISVANISVYVLVSLVLNTLWLSQLYGKAFIALLPSRALFQGIVTVASIILIKVLIRTTDSLNKE